MKILVSILLFIIPLNWFFAVQTPNCPFAPPTYSKTIIEVGCGEYQTNYRMSDSTVWGWFFSSNYYFGQYTFGKKCISLIGAQYDGIALLADSTVVTNVRKANDGSPTWVTVPIDTFGNVFNQVQKIYGNWQTNIAIRHDSIYYWGVGNTLTYGSLGLNSNAIIVKPMPLGQPPGRKVVKVVTVEFAAAGMPNLWVLCDDGTTWSYFYGSATPVQKTGYTGPAIDIAAITRACYVIVTANDILAWGAFASYAGISDGTTTPTSMLSQFTTLGMQLPLKKIVSSYNTLHMIDKNNHMYAIGDAVQGEIGNGKQWPNWRTYTFSGSPAPYAWSFSRGQLMQPALRIPGEWADLCGGSNIAFFFFGKDMFGNWYSWGRNKEDALGNGQRAGNDANYADWGCNPAPTFVNPVDVHHAADFNFDSTNTWFSRPNAGIDRYITNSTDSLYGSFSSQPEGALSSYLWTKISGSGNIQNPFSPNTLVTGLNGTSFFKLTVTGTNGTPTSDTVKILSLSGLFTVPYGAKIIAH